MKLLALLLVLLLAACNDGGGGGERSSSKWKPSGDSWVIGHYQPKGEGDSFEFPIEKPDSETFDDANGMWRSCFDLTGKTSITLRFKIEADPGVKIYPDEGGEKYTGALFLFFQREGDDWSGKGEYATYRWYSNVSKPLVAGEHELTVPFSAVWGGVQGVNSSQAPEAYAKAREKCERIGFVLGGGPTAKGHGVWATGKAKFIVAGFEVR